MKKCANIGVTKSKGVPKMGLRQKRLTLLEFRRKQTRELAKFCVDSGICQRCKSPDKKLKTATLCGTCQDYYKTYAKALRDRPLPKAPKKVKHYEISKKPAKKGK